MKSKFTFQTRASGLLLHPTSLPGKHGSGDLGPSAYRFADFLALAGQHWWQMLPINPPGTPGDAPYSSTSAFAGSPWLISLELLAERGLLERSDLEPEGRLNGDATAQFDLGYHFRLKRLRKAFDAFERRRSSRGVLAQFSKTHRLWLDDYSLYAAIKDRFGGAEWSTWPADLRMRTPAALKAARLALADSIRFHTFVQYEFDRQWNDLHRYCSDLGIGLIGDVPIFVAHDSADVWAHRSLFLLDAKGAPKATSGYPPDIFNRDGQMWGHPQYNWPAHRRSGFAWWVARFKHLLSQFDAARIDHFLGFHRTWHVPQGAKNARKGKWGLSPGDALFTTLRKRLGSPQIIAEDLGQLTEQATRLRDKFAFPGMRILQFGMTAGHSYHSPHAFPPNCVAYTGTHDNNTAVGWLDSLKSDPKCRKQHARIVRYLGGTGRGSSVDLHWKLIRALMQSMANTVIFPVQDVLGLDGRSRMNIPGTADGNWRWRLKEGQITLEHARRLAELCDLFGRTARQVKPPARPSRASRTSSLSTSLP